MKFRLDRFVDVSLALRQRSAQHQTAQIVRIVAQLFLHTPQNLKTDSSEDAADFKQASASFGDLQTAGEARLAKAKMVMNQGFEANRVLPDQDGYVYDKRTAFEPDSDASEWDEGSSDADSAVDEQPSSAAPPVAPSQTGGVGNTAAPPTLPPTANASSNTIEMNGGLLGSKASTYTPSWVSSSPPAAAAPAGGDDEDAASDGSDLSVGDDAAGQLPDEADDGKASGAVGGLLGSKASTYTPSWVSSSPPPAAAAAPAGGDDEDAASDGSDLSVGDDAVADGAVSVASPVTANGSAVMPGWFSASAPGKDAQNTSVTSDLSIDEVPALPGSGRDEEDEDEESSDLDVDAIY